MVDYIFLSLAGLAGGFLAGLLGIGGGIIYVVILPLALTRLGVPANEIVQYTIANSLFGTFAGSFSGTLSHLRRGEVNVGEIGWVGVFSVFAALLSLHFIVNTPYYSQEVFNLFIIIVLLLILVQTLLQARKGALFTGSGLRKGILLSAAGSLGGVVSALTGLGGGAAIVPILNIGLKMDMKHAKAISLGMIVLSSLSMCLYNLMEAPVYDINYYNTGYLVWPLALVLSAGVVVGAPIGVAVARRLPSHIISYIFSVFILIVIGLKSYNLIEAYI